MDYINIPTASSKGGRSKSHPDTTAIVSGLKVYKALAVGFGLLCFLQVALNVWLRLSVNHIVHYHSICQNLSANQDTLRTEYINFDHHFQDGWVYFGTSLYYISSAKASFLNSRMDCEHRGADLVIINSIEEQNFTRKFNKILWIGLSAKNKAWEWVDGSQLTKSFSFWGPNEPNGFENKKEDCVESRFFENVNSWNDIPCEDENFWICEKTVCL